MPLKGWVMIIGVGRSMKVVSKVLVAGKGEERIKG
jgi:hypothetical protein